MRLEFQSMYVCSQAGQSSRNCTRLYCIRSLIQKNVLRKRYLVREAVALSALPSTIRSSELAGTVSMLSAGLRTVSWSFVLVRWRGGGRTSAPHPLTTQDGRLEGLHPMGDPIRGLTQIGS